MFAIIGVLPLGYLAYAGLVFGVGVLTSLITGCDKPKTQGPDDDAELPDGDDLPVDHDAVDVDDATDDSGEIDVPDDDGDIEPDLDETDDDVSDDDVPDGDMPDDDNDPACEPRKGLNPCVAKLSGFIGDIDDSAEGLTLFGGSPSSVYVCETDGLSAATCTAKATLPAELKASQFSATPFGYSIATASPEGAATPVSIFHVDDDAASPGEAIIGRRDISQITIGSGSDAVVLDILGSGGIAVYSAAETPAERFFVGLDAANDGAATSLLGHFRNFDGDLANMGMPAFTRGVVTGGVGTATLDIGEGEKSYVIAINAGKIDASDLFEAGFSVIDASGSSPLRKKNASLGEVELSPIPEIAFGSSGKNAWVAFEKPQAALKLVNLESGTVEKEISLEGSLSGSVKALIASGARIFVGDSAGKIIFVDAEAGSVLGAVELAGAPTACAMRGDFLYCGVNGNLAGIDPSAVELR